MQNSQSTLEKDLHLQGYRFYQYCCVLIAILFCQTTFATNHTENWNTAIITGTLIKNTNFKYYIQPELGFEDDKYVYRSANLFLGAGYQFSPIITLWLMDSWHNRRRTNGDFENLNTIRQQLDWHPIIKDSFTLTCLTRLEERKNYAEPQWAIRLRERIILRVPFKFWENHSFVTFNEIYFDLTNPPWINSNSFIGQNHAFIGIGTKLSNTVSFDLGYLNQYQLRTTGNQINNVLYLLFNVALP